MSNPHTGFGYDIHRLEEGRRLVLGGVEIEYSRGLAGHSDADVLLHAIMDAMLGAAGLPDIGRQFPDTDKRFKNADSRDLLRKVNELLMENSLVVIHLDATLVAEAPRISPHIPKMKTRIAADLQMQKSRISIKATTAEEMGFVGQEKGMKAFAVATVAENNT